MFYSEKADNTLRNIGYIGEQIEIGIFMLMLEVCLEHEGYKVKRVEYMDNLANEAEETLVTEYHLLTQQAD